MEGPNYDAVQLASTLDGENDAMDRNSSGNSLSPIPSNALNSPLPIPAAVLPRISEKESQLASEIGRYVNEKNYEEAIFQQKVIAAHSYMVFRSLRTF